MKKILFIFGLLILVGGGCVNGTDSNPAAQKSVDGFDVQVIDGVEKEFEDGIEIVDVLLGPTVLTVKMEAGNFFFKPNVINALKGDEIEVTFANEGFHTFAIDAIGLDEKIEDGKKITFFAPTEPGEYEFYCSVGNHRAQGQFGTLIVK